MWTNEKSAAANIALLAATKAAVDANAKRVAATYKSVNAKGGCGGYECGVGGIEVVAYTSSCWVEPSLTAASGMCENWCMHTTIQLVYAAVLFTTGVSQRCQQLRLCVFASRAMYTVCCMYIPNRCFFISIRRIVFSFLCVFLRNAPVVCETRIRSNQ